MTDHTQATDENAEADAGKPSTDSVTKATIDMDAEASSKSDQKAKKDKKPKKDPFCFTDPGCRTELRLGALLTVGPVFLWMWLKPDVAVCFLVLGLPLLWAGVVFQALQARKQQRPGYPWKLGIAFALLGGLMIPDQISQVIPGGALHLQIQAPALCLSGLWILGWWFYARQTSDIVIENGDALHG